MIIAAPKKTAISGRAKIIISNTLTRSFINCTWKSDLIQLYQRYQIM
jgi:hypothetical protein